MAVFSQKFSFGMDINTVTIGGNGLNSIAHINKYAVDLTGVDYIRARTYFSNVNVSIVIQNPIGTTLWQSGFKNSGTNSPYIVTFTKSEIPVQYQINGVFIGIAYETAKAMQAFNSATPTQINGIKLYDKASNGTIVYDYPSYTQPIEINYIQETRKYLVQNGTDDNTSPIVYYSSGAWQTVAEKTKNTLSESDFTTYGMDSLPTNSQIASLPGAFRLLTWSNIADGNLAFSMKAVPKPQIVFASGNFGLLNVQEVNYFELIGAEAGGGVVRAIVSNDSGSSYYGHNGTNFVPLTFLDKNNPTDAEKAQVAQYGMTLSQLKSNGITNWAQIFPSETAQKYASWAYYLDITASTDTAYTDTLSVSLDRKGRERIAKCTEFTQYISDNQINVEWLGANQDELRINYIDPNKNI